MRRLWRWLFKYSQKKIRQDHMDTYKNDIKCHGCNTWFSISGVSYKHKYVGKQPDWGVRVKCGQCGFVSNFNLCIAPVAIFCDDNGIPLQ